MCGFVALFNPQREPAPHAVDLLKRMTDSLQHRGPDAQGYHIEPHIALGHRRLSIIDVSTGQQPLFNEDGSVVVVFNGEIYNFRELVGELQRAGHVFRTQSDTEVIVHGWEQWGQECVQHFRGMFAFALWDRSRRTVFVARDRMGVKPAHYAITSRGGLAVASEIKALKLVSGVDLTIDETAIEDYLALGYIPDPKSIFRGIHKLPAAHCMTWEVGRTEPVVRRYWQAVFEPDQTYTLARASDELNLQLTEAVRIRMIAEVPIGAFLSGGVDSSVVVERMSKLSPDPVKTCTIGFQDDDVDESDHALLVAKQFATDHQVEVCRSDSMTSVETILALFDEPFADSSALPTFMVSAIARKRVTVALSGDGSDETFGGYRRHRMHLAEQRVRDLLPSPIRAVMFGSLGRIYPKADWAPQSLRAKTTFQGLSKDAVHAYGESVSYIKTNERHSIYQPSFASRLSGYSAIETFRRHAASFQGDDPLALIQHLDYETYLPGDINTKVDRASMANSLEVREPFMDHHLVEWAAKLPSKLKVFGHEGKYVLKQCMARVLPASILYRPKQGFNVPISRWMKAELGDEFERTALSSSSGLGEVLSIEKLRALLRAHRLGAVDAGRTLWSCMLLAKFLTSRA